MPENSDSILRDMPSDSCLREMFKDLGERMGREYHRHYERSLMEYWRDGEAFWDEALNRIPACRVSAPGMVHAGDGWDDGRPVSFYRPDPAGCTFLTPRYPVEQLAIIEDRDVQLPHPDTLDAMLETLGRRLGVDLATLWEDLVTTKLRMDRDSRIHAKGGEPVPTWEEDPLDGPDYVTGYGCCTTGAQNVYGIGDLQKIYQEMLDTQAEQDKQFKERMDAVICNVCGKGVTVKDRHTIQVCEHLRLKLHLQFELHQKFAHDPFTVHEPQCGAIRHQPPGITIEPLPLPQGESWNSWCDMWGWTATAELPKFEIQEPRLVVRNWSQ